MPKKLNDASITTITSLNDADYMNTVDASTGAISKILISNVKGSIVPKTYAALITQTGTGDPSASPIAINTLGATITFSRNGVGDYNATASGSIFTSNKTMVFILNGDTAASFCAVRMSATVINFKTTGDDVFSYASFKIEIYP